MNLWEVIKSSNQMQRVIFPTLRCLEINIFVDITMQRMLLGFTWFQNSTSLLEIQFQASFDHSDYWINILVV